jgi:hypothetical protein
MKLEMEKNLFDKYYKGETSVEEENDFKKLVLSEETDSAEKDIFEYFRLENAVPGNLEETIFSGIENELCRKKTNKIRLYSLSSAAAVILVLLSVYVDFRKEQNAKIENDFFVMEQALFQVSKSIQPEEQEEMLVLWVDDNVEIIIN